MVYHVARLSRGGCKKEKELNLTNGQRSRQNGTWNS